MLEVGSLHTPVFLFVCLFVCENPNFKFEDFPGTICMSPPDSLNTAVFINCRYFLVSRSIFRLPFVFMGINV